MNSNNDNQFNIIRDRHQTRKYGREIDCLQDKLDAISRYNVHFTGDQ